MAKGDFARLIQPRITKNSCESCGQNNWQVFEEQNGEAPRIVCLPTSGGFAMPPSGVDVVLAVCGNCFYTRLYSLPASTPSGASPTRAGSAG